VASGRRGLGDFGEWGPVEKKGRHVAAPERKKTFVGKKRKDRAKLLTEKHNIRNARVAAGDTGERTLPLRSGMSKPICKKGGKAVDRMVALKHYTGDWR